MIFPKLSSPTLKELFVNEIERMILSGELPVGTRLPSERELAERMQVSRGVVNSGLTEMAKKGFLEIRPRVGALVSDYRRTGTLETLLSIMRYNGGVLRRDEIKSFLEIRLVLETLALNLGVPSMTDEDAAALERRLAACGEARDRREAAAAIFAFHHELCVISGNTILPLIFQSFREPVLKLWERYLSLHGPDRLLSNAREILDLARSGDAPGAVAALKASIDGTIAGNPSIYFD